MIFINLLYTIACAIELVDIFENPQDEIDCYDDESLY
jgi:hypothetical protein